MKVFKFLKLPLRKKFTINSHVMKSFTLFKRPFMYTEKISLKFRPTFEADNLNEVSEYSM